MLWRYRYISLEGKGNQYCYSCSANYDVNIDEIILK